MSLFSRWIDHIRERRDARELTPTGILHKAEANLEPGILTADGFLGRDNRRLLRILGDDAREFADQGLDWAAVANRLEEFLDLGAAGLGEPITVEGRYLVHVAETRGCSPAPGKTDCGASEVSRSNGWATPPRAPRSFSVTSACIS